MSELDDLVKRRSIARRRFTKAEKYVIEAQTAAGLLISEGGSQVDIQLKVEEFFSAFNALEKTHGELCEVQDEIDYHEDNEARLEAAPDDGEEKYIKSYNQLCAKRRQLDHHMSKMAANDKVDEEASSHSSKAASFTMEDFKTCFQEAMSAAKTGIDASQLQQVLETLTQKKIEIKIPKFRGDPELFDQWQSLVQAEVSKPGYSEVEKAHIVISLVDGEVSKLVASLKDPTYDELMDFLEHRYGDVLARIELAINEIANIEPVNNPNVKELDPFYNKLIANWNYITKQTKSDAESVVKTSWMLTALVRPKLPKSLTKRWDSERIKSEKSGNISILPIQFDELLEKIQDAVKVARRSASTPVVPSVRKKEQTKKDIVKERHEKPKPSGYALSVTKNRDHKATEKHSCVFCESNHLSYTCPKVREMSVNQRCDRVKSARVCFNCLGPHMVRDCKKGGCKTCGKNHHTLLHFDKRKESGEREPSKGEGNYKSKETKEKSNSSVEKVDSFTGLVKSSGATKVLMQTGIAHLESKYGVTNGRVLFDSGSGVTFISRKIANRLSLRGPKVDGEFVLAGGGKMSLKTEKVKFLLSSALPGWKGETFEIEGYVIEKPSADLNPVEIDISRLPHLKGLQLADTYPRGKQEIDVMLGIEDTTNVLMDKRIKGQSCWPVAQRSHIGWVLSGPCPDSSTKLEESKLVNQISFEIKDETEIAIKHWETEHIGIQPHENKVPTELELSAMRQHEEKTRQIGNRYETGLIRHPRYIDERLKSNKSQAVKRLIGLERRLQRDSNLADLYQTQINELLSSGRAERVKDKEEPKDRQVWYLPHHPVLKPDSVTTKLRIVFDGSMVGQEGISLNDTLLPGPALQPDLPGVLMRFRRHKVTIVADIEKMFLQVQMREEDRDMQRFLWRDLDTSKEPQVYRLTTVTFGLTSSPFSSIQTVRDHARKYEQECPKAAEEIVNNTFVDDVLTGEEAVQDAANLAVDLKTIMKEGGWPLKKFRSNKPDALSLLDEKDLATGTKMVGEEMSKTLGVIYEPTEDVLRFSFCQKMEDIEEETKRTILRQLHRVYDPLGMVAPFTVVAKQIFQMSWMTGLGWDERVPEELEQKWMRWKSEVATLDFIKVQRCLIPEDFTNPTLTLHGFGDASEAAYGGVVYLRVEDSSSDGVHTALLCSKTRVAPVGKRRTIPELELMASLTLARLITYVEKELKLPIRSKTCWTDSQVVLHWIRQPAYNWQTFVSNRVSEIQGLVPPSDWRHVPGKHNPADLCSRGMSASDLVESSLWWNGPEFLRDEESTWPEQPVIQTQSKDEARKKEKQQKLTTVFNVVVEPDPMEEYVNQYSSFAKFIRVMTIVRSWLKKHRERSPTVRNEGSPLTTVKERKEEELEWIRWAQQKAFSEEIKMLKGGEILPRKSKLIQLNPYWDQDKRVIRVGGRLHYTKLPEETKNPIILPTHNPLVEKLVMHTHIQNLHTGAAQTLATLRNHYWILHGRQEVRRILHSCKRCREPIKMEQRMGPLPSERTGVTPVFSNVGIDFAGPLYVKTETGEQKVYICLFSCMVSRAIHLELVQDLSTEHFILALKRMMSRRGRIRLIISDNAKTFKKASSILQCLFKEEKKLREKLDAEGIEWRFITERAPWQGGFYERMVKSVKKPLKRVLGKSRLTVVELETVLTEIEAQINSRPLTSLSSSSEDLAALTPGHLAVGRSLQVLPDLDKETSATSLGKRWRYQQRLSKEFWRRWTNEYLLELNTLKKWVDVQKNVKVDDVVLIAEDNQPRHDWLLGRVTEVHPGRDGLVRSVTLITKKGVRRRPVQRLRMLEASIESKE